MNNDATSQTREDFEEIEGSPSEPATKDGFLAQLMRHNEINSKNSLVAMGYVIQACSKEMKKIPILEKKLQALEKDLNKVLKKLAIKK